MAEKFTELFKMFCADVKDEVAKLCGFDVEVRDVTKNNGVKRKGLYFGEGNWTEISKEEYYERKERQITAADISREIKEAMEDEK